MTMSVQETRELYTEQYHIGLGDPPASFAQHYKNEYLLLVEPKAGEQLCEIGCSSGRATEVLVRAGVHITSIDFDEKACDLARKRLQRNNLEGVIHCCSADEFEDYSLFEKVTMLDFVEHVSDEVLIKVLDNLKKTFRGTLYVYTPNSKHPYEIAQRWGLLQRDITHINLKSWKDWLSFFEAHGFNLVRKKLTTSHASWVASIEKPLISVPWINQVFARSLAAVFRIASN
jgi:2-polyprenyl-3-methyl-5-hydroxy-6-metoxy-1,4-benzoquinol methylase